MAVGPPLVYADQARLIIKKKYVPVFLRVVFILILSKGRHWFLERCPWNFIGGQYNSLHVLDWETL